MGVIMSKVMLYKASEVSDVKGFNVVYQIVDDEQVESMIDNGWRSSPAEAEKVGDLDYPPTREELEEKATELNIKFRKNTPNDKLLQLISDALSE